MPNVGDELHHYGWNRCSSACHGPDRVASDRARLPLVPGPHRRRGRRSAEARDREGDRARRDRSRRPDLTRPHTVHCMPGDNVVISMLGDAEGNGAGGFAVLDAKTFEVEGRWENGGERPPLNYDFWYQPRHNVLVSSELGEPNTFKAGFNPEDVAAGKYGQRLHFWDLETRDARAVDRPRRQRADPARGALAARPRRSGRASSAPRSPRAHVALAPRRTASGRSGKVIGIDGVELEGWPFPVPGLITDLVLSMDDRFLYFSNWLHGDLRQYDVCDPRQPEADRAGLARRRPRQAERRRARAERRTADAAAVASTAGGSTSRTRSTRPGTTSSTPSCVPGSSRSTAIRREACPSTRGSSSTSTTGRAAPPARTRCGSKVAIPRRRSSSDRRAPRGRTRARQRPGCGRGVAVRIARPGQGSTGRAGGQAAPPQAIGRLPI